MTMIDAGWFLPIGVLWPMSLLFAVMITRDVIDNRTWVDRVEAYHKYRSHLNEKDGEIQSLQKSVAYWQGEAVGKNSANNVMTSATFDSNPPSDNLESTYDNTELLKTPIPKKKRKKVGSKAFSRKRRS